MKTYNDIGIGRDLDWGRIRKLFCIGLIAGIMVLIGDMLLGWGVSDESLSGIAKKLSAYAYLSDKRLVWSAMLGFIGIPLEGLCYFGIYRLISPYSEKYAHMLRSGIIGYIAFGGCGVHVPCLAVVFYYKQMISVILESAVSRTVRFGELFLLPGIIAFLIFFIVQSVAQITAFSKGFTPYPRWCWITANIPQWRYILAMTLAFPGIILYGIALFAVQSYIREDKERRIMELKGKSNK